MPDNLDIQSGKKVDWEQVGDWEIDWGKIKKIGLLPVNENQISEGTITILEEKIEWMNGGVTSSNDVKPTFVFDSKNVKFQGFRDVNGDRIKF